MSEIKKGLEGVIIAESDIAFIDGDNGVLEYRGIPIEELAHDSTFEEAAYLLWYGSLPTREQLSEFEETIVANRQINPVIIEMLRTVPKHAKPMEVLRSAVSMLSLFDERAEDMSFDAIYHKAVRIAAKIPTIVTAYDRIRRGLEPVAPNEDLSCAANFLFMMNARHPEEVAVRTLDACLILHAEHGLNASTFAGRVTSSTLSDLYSAITTAIGTLKGPLHGGANQAAMRMLLEIGSLENVDHWILSALARGQRIMGFGHPVYRVMDPRAKILKTIAKAIAERSTNKWFTMSLRIEEILRQERNLYPNVDFYTASSYYLMGLPIDLFTTIFAMSRIVGWTAHILEQRRNNRLIRPRSKYIGEHDRSYVSIEQRS